MYEDNADVSSRVCHHMGTLGGLSPTYMRCWLCQVKQIQAPKSSNGRDGAPRGPSLSDRLLEWLHGSNIKERIGGDLALLKWLARSLLIIGGRSIGHLYSYLDRHEPIMNDLIVLTGDEVSCNKWLHMKPFDLWQGSISHLAFSTQYYFMVHHLSVSTQYYFMVHHFSVTSSKLQRAFCDLCKGCYGHCHAVRAKLSPIFLLSRLPAFP